MQHVHKTIRIKSRKICSVPQCSSYCTDEISLHSFPSDEKLRKVWQTVLKIGKPVTKNMLVFSLHFQETDFFPAVNKRRRIKLQVIPSKKLPQSSHPSKKQTIDRSRRHWLQKCASNIFEENEEIETKESESPDIESTSSKPEQNLGQNPRSVAASNKHTIAGDFYIDKATETDFSGFELLQMLNSDEKLSSFAGINLDTLKTVTKCTQRTADYNRCNWSNMETRILLVLCKFKMNISFACLAILFNISKTLTVNMFYSTVSLLVVSLKPAIYWPTKEEVLCNMPKCFEKFENTRVVLDCTEIKIQKLKCLKCRVMSYSQYKRAHTIKYLIGITPSGVISFVSAGFGGRATDQAIFNHENLIDKMDMHDAIMVDKGILIEKECDEKFVKLIRPPFLRKQKQLSKEDAERTADIARARVHVERAIQRIKIFKILRQHFDWYLIPYADKIMTIIASIVNLSPPILADDKID